MPEVTKEVQKKDERTLQKKETRRRISPDVDVIEKNEEFVLIADMPGVDEKGLDLTLEKDILIIRGETSVEIPEEYRLRHSEYSEGRYERRFTLSQEIDRDRIKATIKNGVLRIVLPKADTAKIKKIEVTSE